MNKFDFFISGVWKDNNETISHVLMHKVNTDNSFLSGVKVSSETAIGFLKRGNVIYTVNWKYPGWYIGAEVTYVSQHGREFLRSIHNGVKEDNLDNLILMKSIHNG